MTSERETQRGQQQAQREGLAHAHTLEVDELTAEMTALQRERDDALLIAENEKQQVLSLIGRKKSPLQEKLGIAQDELSGLGLEYERLKRD